MNDFYIPRRCRKEEEKRDESHQPKILPEEEIILPEEEIKGLRAYVLLAEPGMGKSKLFRRQAQECGGEFITVREFLLESKFSSTKEWKQPLFLDGLDEARAGGGDGRNVIDEIYVELKKIEQNIGEKLRFRMSCRSAVWRDYDDRKVLQSVVQGIDVFSLEPLAENEIKEFLQKKYGLNDESFQKPNIEILKNPLLLELSVQAYSEGNTPESRSEIYDMAVDNMLREVNRGHQDIEHSTITIGSEKLKKTAGEMFAVMLGAGKSGFSKDNDVKNGIIKIEELPGNGMAYRYLLKSKLFITREGGAGGVYEPLHRSVAEFLGGRYLAGKVNNAELSAERASVFCGGGGDGGVASDLRGLHGWLTTYVSNKDDLLKKDPTGFMVFGDPRKLARNELELLINAQAENRYQRIQYRYESAFFCRPDMKGIFSHILGAKKYDDIYQEKVYIVLSALMESNDILGLHKEITAIACDSKWEWGVRLQAADLLCKFRDKLLPETMNEMVKYLDVLANKASKELLSGSEKEISEKLLLILHFRHHIHPSDVGKYYFGIQMSIGTIGFWNNEEVFDKMDAQTAGEIWDGLANLEKIIRAVAHTLYFVRKETTFERKESTLAGMLLSKTIKENMDDRDVEVFCGRLDKCRQFYLSAGKENELKEILNHNPQLFPRLSYSILDNMYAYKGLYFLWMRYSSPFIKKEENNIIWNNLSKATGEKKRKIMELWFHLYLYKCCTKKEIIEFIKNDTELMEHFRELRKKRIANRAKGHQYRIENRIYQKEDKERQLEREKEYKNISEILRNGIDSLRKGERPDWLSNLVYLIKYESNENERRKIIVTDDIEAAFYEGCKAVVYLEKRLPTAAQIIQACEESKDHGIMQVCIVGIEKVYEENPKILLQLPDEQILRILIYVFLGNAIEHPWLNYISEKKHNIVIKALHRLTAKLKKKEILNASWLVGKYCISFTDDELLLLLNKLPARSPQYHFLTAIARIILGRNQKTLRDSLKTLTEDKLADKSMLRKQYVCWLAIGLCLDMDVCDKSNGMVKDVKLREIFAELFIVYEMRHSLSDFAKSLSLSQQKKIIQILAPYVRNRSFNFDSSSGEAIWGTSDMTIGEFVENLIKHIGSQKSRDATNLLRSLIDIKELKPWQTILRYALSESKAIVRDAEFGYMEVKKAVGFLKQKLPHNVEDLREALIENLLSLQNEYRDGNTDGWKKFWNGDGRKDASKPKEENDCRNCLVDDLRPRLKFCSITPENQSAGARRVDFLLNYDNRIELPVEVKRANNRELWRGIKDQLIDYARRPNANGCGLYLVFWFGKKYLPPMPPQGESKPRTSKELEDTLIQQIKKERLANDANIKAFVMDVSPPEKAIKA